MESEELRGVEAAFDDVLHGVLVSAVPLPPVRAGIGKGIGQRDCECSLATSVCVSPWSGTRSLGGFAGRRLQMMLHEIVSLPLGSSELPFMSWRDCPLERGGGGLSL